MRPGRGGRPTRTTPLPEHPGNIYRPFADLIDIEKIDDRTYRSIAPAFSPGGPLGAGRSYGAHVYMQAAWAASQTVAPGFLLHHVSGNFLLGGELNVPFVYKVHIIRNGRSYCTRIVNVTQREGKGICFTCICSFKTPEHEQFDAQEELNLFDKYSIVLDGKKPADFPETPGMDLPFYRKLREETGVNDQFPGLECRTVDMSAYNRDRHPFDRRQLLFFRAIGDLPDDDNVHLCAHLYASDRNSLYIVANHLELADHYTGMGSLAHTFIFHSRAQAMRFGAPPSTKTNSLTSSPMDDKTGRWFCMEVWGSRLGGGRGVHNCRIWNSEGEHVATSIQDGMIRLAANPQKPTAEELKLVESSMRKWKSVKREEKL